MAKTPSHITPLPAELLPTKSSTQLINEHVQRLRDCGVPQKTIALTLGFGPNYVSMLKAGVDDLPLPRVMAFASAVRLSDAERRELLDTRLKELHGAKAEICVETLANWAVDLVSPVGDEGKLIDIWRETTSPAPHLLAGLLEDPTRVARIRAAMEAVVQEELRAMADEASIP
jgi:hypothetical protein